MPKITRAPAAAHAPHPESHVGAADRANDDTCSSCSLPLKGDADHPSASCSCRSAPDSRTAGALPRRSSSPRSPAQSAASRSRPPRGRAGRARQRGPANLHGRRDGAHRRARVLAYGRRRAALRVAGPSYDPHPAWRNFLEEGWRIVIDQGEALRTVEAMVAEQDWRGDKQFAWLAIMRQLVCSMDWETGLVSALTAERLGSVGGRARRTVSRVLAWAREVGLIVVVEHGASAAFLGTRHGRTPTYAFVTTTPLQPSTTADLPQQRTPRSEPPVYETGDPSLSQVDLEPLNGRRQARTNPRTPRWPAFGVPESPTDRTAATLRFLEELGLDGRRVSGVPLWRTRALLRAWWEEGACPRALEWAVHHHPDRPEQHCGDLLRGARDPLRVLGSRLRAWRGRLGELPAAVVGVRGNYLLQREVPTEVAADPPAHGEFVPTTSADRRAQLRARFAAEQASRRWTSSGASTQHVR